jgi:hypothetical protein
MNYIVISDLHIGGNTQLDIFRSQVQLASFLKSLKGGPTGLIINGDFVDFLAVKPFGIFSREAAVEKIEQIVSAPPNRQLWEGFQAFLAEDKRNRIDILLGNHDIELVFEEVQTALAVAIGGSQDSQRVRFLIDRLSYPRLVVGGVHVHVEHGFQYDPFNWYDHNKLIQATQFKQDGSDFELPVGSKLVYEVLNKVTPNHPYMPLLKPEAAAFWMLAALAPGQILRRGGRTVLIGSGTLMASLRKYLSGAQLGPDESAPLDGLTPLQSQLAQMLFDDHLTDNTIEDLEEFIDMGTGDEKSPTGVTFAGGPLLRGKLFFVRRALRSLKEQRDNFFDPTASDDFRDALNTLLNQGAKVALFGHSHGRKMLPLVKEGDAWVADPLLLKSPTLVYLNTGTWADLLDFDLNVLANDDAVEQWLDNLEVGKVNPTLIFTYARLEELSPNQGVRVSLEEWRDGQSHVVNAQEVPA